MRDIVIGWSCSALVWVGQVGSQNGTSWEPITIAGVAPLLLAFLLRTYERMQSDQKLDRQTLIQVIQDAQADRQRLMTVIEENTRSNIRLEARFEEVLERMPPGSRI